MALMMIAIPTLTLANGLSKKVLKTFFLLIASLFILTSVKLQANNISPVIIEEASIVRMKTIKTSHGLRFFSTLDQKRANSNHGFYLIYGKTTIAELEEALLNDNLINDKKVIKVPVNGVDEENMFSVTLTDIPKSGFLDLITVISYVIDNNKTYYSNPFITSMGEAALQLTKQNLFVSRTLIELNKKVRVGFDADGNFITNKGIYEVNKDVIIKELVSDWNNYFSTITKPTLSEIEENLDEFLKNHLRWDWLKPYFSHLINSDEVTSSQIIASFYNFIYSTNSGDAADFSLKTSYQKIKEFNNRIVVSSHDYEFYNIGDTINLPSLTADKKIITHYLLNNIKYEIKTEITLDENYNEFKPNIINEEIKTIKDFISYKLNGSYISGVITSFGSYNSISVEDKTGQIALRVASLNANDFLDLDYQIGDQVLARVNLTDYAGLTQAEVIGDLYKLSSNNNLKVPINLNNSALDNLSLYQQVSSLVSLDDLTISSKNETAQRYEFILSKTIKNIKLVVDKRLSTIDFSYIEALKIGDIVNLEGALLSWYNGPELTIDNVSQLIKTGETDIGEDGISQYKIFYLNDTHGAILNSGSELGLARIGNYINNTKDENSIFIAGGDMFQGQLISNNNKGELMIKILNELELDAFVLGNHEFDWGLEIILQYFNHNTDGVKANFPLLGANVKSLITNKRPEFIDSHVIIERGNQKIGIVGVIGDGLESSISYFKVKDYEFTDAYTAVKNTINQIKDEVDFIIVVNHASDNTFNNKVSSLPKVSAIFNGHTHKSEINKIGNIPVLQSGSDSKMVGEVDLTFEKIGYLVELLNSSVKNVSYHPYLNTDDQSIKQLIDSYYEDLTPLYEDVILTAAKSMNKEQLAYFISRLMKEATGSVAGFQNSGGTRATLTAGQKITAADIFQITPFENKIIVANVWGSDLKILLNDTYFYTTSDVNVNEVKNNQLYQVATNDYVFFSKYNYKVFGYTYDEAVEFGDMYEVFHQVLLNLKDIGYTTFDTTSPIYYYTDYSGYILTNDYILFDERKKLIFN